MNSETEKKPIDTEKKTSASVSDEKSVTSAQKKPDECLQRGADPAQEKTEEKEEKDPAEIRKKRLLSLYDWVEVIAISIAIVIFIFTCIARLSSVDGSSMLPTLQDGNKVIVSRLFYKPERGDIVAVQKEEGFTKPLVKRVIALGGETVIFDFPNWQVTIRKADGTEITLEEPYINYIYGTVMNRYSIPYSNEITVPEGYLFVMGDNRNASSDSRDAIIGLIAECEVMGHVVFRLSPLSEIGPLH